MTTTADANKALVRALYEECINGRDLPSHAEVMQEGNVIYQVRDGQIVRAWLQADRLGVLQQIGVVPRAFAEAQGQRPI
jgi:predicted ester cyclase